MRTMILIAAVLGGCSLYSGDDEPIDPGVDAGLVEVDAAPMAVTTTYGVRWECISSGNCVSPLARETLASVRELDGDVSITWYHDGALAPVAVHGGAMSGGCIQVLAGADSGLARDNYNACPIPGAPAPALESTITWAASTWRATLTRQ